MNNKFNQIFTPQYLRHLNRDFCYFSDNEISNLGDLPSLYLAMLPSLVAIKFSGADVLEFLQGQLTLDLDDNLNATLGCYLSRKGRIISLFYCAKHQDSYYLFMPLDISQVFIKQIKKYVMLSKVNITIENKLVIAFDRKLFNSLDEELFKEEAQVILEKQVITLIPENNFQELKQLQAKSKVTIIGDLAWHKNQLYKLLPSIYPSTIAKFLPHDIELQTKNALDFKKGCYIGQEIVARMHYKAKLKYKLKLVETNQIDLKLEDELIIDDRSVGKIIDYLPTSDNKYLCLIAAKKL